MLDRIAGNAVRTIIVESPDRFARHLAVQLAGHSRDRKIAQGITGEARKARAKLRAVELAPECGGHKSHAERSPELVAAAKTLQAERPRLSPRKIASRLAEQGFVGTSGLPYAAISVRSMLQG
jgi:hypothetical protein